MPWHLRVISAIGGLMLIYPGWETDIIGIVLVGAIAVIQYLGSKKVVAA